MKKSPNYSIVPTISDVLANAVAAVESLQLLEALYGYLTDNGCRIVGIADELSDEQRDAVWDINWEWQAKYPQLDIEIVLIQRHGRPMVDVFNEVGSAMIKREFASVQ